MRPITRRRNHRLVRKAFAPRYIASKLHRSRCRLLPRGIYLPTSAGLNSSTEVAHIRLTAGERFSPSILKRTRKRYVGRYPDRHMNMIMTDRSGIDHQYQAMGDLPALLSLFREPKLARNSQLQSGLVFGFWGMTNCGAISRPACPNRQ
jgi:hypothetical protein